MYKKQKREEKKKAVDVRNIANGLNLKNDTKNLRENPRKINVNPFLPSTF